MSQSRVLMLTFPPVWARELRKVFGPETVDILVKARNPGSTFLAEHTLYDPATDAIVDVPKAQLREIELSLRRCYTGNADATPALARQIYSNAKKMLAESAYRRVIFRTVPHMPHELAIYHCAKNHSIDTLFFDETGYFKRAFIYKNIYKRKIQDAISIKSRSKFTMTAEQRKIASLDDLRKNYHGLRTVGQGFFHNLTRMIRAYLYVIKASIKGESVAGSAGLSRNLSSNNLFDRLLFWTKSMIKTARLRGILSRLEAEGPGLSTVKDSIIFLLNFQPERTTLPDAYPYYDLLDGVKELGRVGRPIFVKEHPIQLNYPGDGALLRGATWRSRKFYEELSRRTAGFLPRTREVDERLATDNVIATTTGTVAVELFFRKIPVLVLANNWLSSLPNVVRTSTLDIPPSDLTYDPFETFETIFDRTVGVINWAELMPQDILILDEIVNAPVDDH